MKKSTFLQLLLHSFFIFSIFSFSLRAQSTLCLEIKSSKPDTAQLFYDIGQGLSEANSAKVTLKGNSEFERVEFAIPAGNIKALRFDPLEMPGSVELRSLNLKSSDKQIAIPFAQITSLKNIAVNEVRDDVVYLETTPDATDPQLLIAFQASAPVSGKQFKNSWIFYSLVGLIIFIVLSFLIQICVVKLKVSSGATTQKVNSEMSASHLFIFVLLITSLSFPLVITFDGHLYHHLASIISPDMDFESWDVIRTPLFPLFLKCFSVIFGPGASSVVLMNSLLCFFAFRFLQKSIGDLPLASWYILAIVSAFSPLTITYAHMYLSETMLSLCVAFLIYSFVRYDKSWFSCLFIFLVANFAYYTKPTFFYIYIGLFLSTLGIQIVSKFISPQQCFDKIDLKFYVVVVLAVISMLPWQGFIAKSGRMGDVKAFFCVKQLAVSPEYFSNPNARSLYSEIYSKYSSRLGGLGVPDGLVYPICGLLTQNEKSQILSFAWQNNTSYMIKRLFATLGVYFFSYDSENKLFAYNVLKDRSDDLNKIYPGPEHLIAEVRHQYQSRAFSSPFGNFIFSLLPLYSFINGFSLLLIPFALFYGFKNNNAFLFFSSLVVLIYIFLHAVGLLSIDRYAFPVNSAAFFVLMSLVSKMLKKYV